MSRLLEAPDHGTGLSSALLVLRIVVGVAFVLHGWPKIREPFGWMAPPALPAALQALAAVAEFFGGVGLVLGLLTPLVAMGIACTMAVAVARHVLVKRDPFLGGYELAAVYLSVAVLVLLAGPGRFSLDRALWAR